MAGTQDAAEVTSSCCVDPSKGISLVHSKENLWCNRRPGPSNQQQLGWRCRTQPPCDSSSTLMNPVVLLPLRHIWRAYLQKRKNSMEIMVITGPTNLLRSRGTKSWLCGKLVFCVCSFF
ncbi:hypothetical protein ZWY2020_006147 [Hordeum vulgare]|nr:hypothetical protein ZWY2020_006147 [Hordeum vulgare]